MTTPMTRSKLRKETSSLYSDMMAFYKRFSKAHEPGAMDLQRMKMNLDRLNPTSTGEQIEAIRFLEFFWRFISGKSIPHMKQSASACWAVLKNTQSGIRGNDVR